MKKHQIELTKENLELAAEWVNEKRVEYASAFGNNQNKHLYRDLNGNWIVESYGEIVCQTTNTYTAIEKYNEC